MPWPQGNQQHYKPVAVVMDDAVAFNTRNGDLPTQRLAFLVEIVPGIHLAVLMDHEQQPGQMGQRDFLAAVDVTREVLFTFFRGNLE